MCDLFAPHTWNEKNEVLLTKKAKPHQPPHKKQFYFLLDCQYQNWNFGSNNNKQQTAVRKDTQDGTKQRRQTDWVTRVQVMTSSIYTAADDGTAATRYYDDDNKSNFSSSSYFYNINNNYCDRLFVLNMTANIICLVFYVWGRNRPSCVTYYKYVRYLWVLQYWVIFDRTDTIALASSGDEAWRVSEKLGESLSIGIMALLRTIMSPSWMKPTLQIMIMYGFLTDYFILDTFVRPSKSKRLKENDNGFGGNDDGDKTSRKKTMMRKKKNNLHQETDNEDAVDVGKIMLRVATNFCHHLYPFTASSCRSWVQTVLCAVTYTTHLHPWFDVLGRRSWMGPCFMVGNWMPLLGLVDYWYFDYASSRADTYPTHAVVLTQMIFYRTLFANSVFKVFSTKLKLMTVEQEVRMSDILRKGLLVYSMICAAYISPWW